jgi:hypothetical protein
VLDLLPVIEPLIADLAHNVKKSKTSIVIDLGIRDFKFFSDLLGTQTLHSISPHNFPFD